METIKISGFCEAFRTLSSCLKEKGITPENIEEFAKFYSYWHKNEALRIPCKECKMVYQTSDGKLVSLPFVEKSLENYHLGFQAGNLCFVIEKTKCIKSDQIETFLKETSDELNREIRLLTSKEFNEFRFLYYEEIPGGLVLRYPYDEKREDNRRAFTEGELLCHEFKSIGDAFNPCNGLWWTKDGSNIKKEVNYHETLGNGRFIGKKPNPKELLDWVNQMELALVIPVFTINPAMVLSGELDENGIPTKETMERIEQNFSI